jgi:hypothetical protein
LTASSSFFDFSSASPSFLRDFAAPFEVPVLFDSHSSTSRAPVTGPGAAFVGGVDDLAVERGQPVDPT